MLDSVTFVGISIDKEDNLIKPFLRYTFDTFFLVKIAIYLPSCLSKYLGILIDLL